MGNKINFKAVSILSIVLVVGIGGLLLFDNVDSLFSYVFLGELPLTGQVVSSACAITGGTCKLSCSTGESISGVSCEEVLVPGISSNFFYGGILVSNKNSLTCCMPDFCGNGIAGVGEECDDGNIYDGDGCSSRCEIEDNPNYVAFCRNGVCEIGESCSTCVQDCADIIGEPACEEGFVCAEDFGFGTCEIFSSLTCGNGLIEGNEECDFGALSEDSSDDNLNGSTCASRGFSSGVLTCADNCVFDTSSCIASTNNPGGSPGGSSPPIEKTCSEVEGSCASTCSEGFVHYGIDHADNVCSEDYMIPLICCVAEGEQFFENDSSSGSGEDPSSEDSPGEEELDSGSDESDINSNSEIGSIKKIFTTSDYLLVKILILIGLIFAIFFVGRQFHLSFWDKLTRRILFPSRNKKEN
jgi:cysteine-rich repeat protein